MTQYCSRKATALNSKLFQVTAKHHATLRISITHYLMSVIYSSLDSWACT